MWGGEHFIFDDLLVFAYAHNTQKALFLNKQSISFFLSPLLEKKKTNILV